MKDNSKS